MNRREAKWTCLWDAGAYVGEGTLWDERDGCVYWVDINPDAPSVNWFELATGTTHTWRAPMWLSALAVREAGGFIASAQDGLAFVDPARGHFEIFSDPRSDPRVTRYNDGGTDRQGRYWTGTCDVAQVEASTRTEDKEASVGSFTERRSGELFRIDAARHASRTENNLVTSNGPVFSPDGRTMYLNDTMPQITWAYDVAADGSIGNRRQFLRFGAEDGFPDGMAVDVEGGIWIAFYEGWELRRYAPDATLLDARRLPVRQGLRPAFGGENYSRLFLMSGSIALSEAARRQQPLAGSLFEIHDPGVCGLNHIPYRG